MCVLLISVPQKQHNDDLAEKDDLRNHTHKLEKDLATEQDRVADLTRRLEESTQGESDLIDGLRKEVDDLETELAQKKVKYMVSYCSKTAQTSAQITI